MNKITELKPEMDFFYDLRPIIEDRVRQDLREHYHLNADAEVDFNDYKDEALDYASSRCWEYVERLNSLKIANGIKLRRYGMKHLYIDYCNLVRDFENLVGVEHQDFQIEGDHLPF